MAGRPAPKPVVHSSISNKEIALELAKAALVGGLARASEPTPAGSQDASTSQARADAFYLADLFHHTVVRLDRRDAQE